jgi:hypothetical protein
MFDITILQWISTYNNTLLTSHEKYTWTILLNCNLHAVFFLSNNMHLINWSYLSLNANAIYLLERNLDKINCDNL